jgi:hypothetical protein
MNVSEIFAVPENEAKHFKSLVEAPFSMQVKGELGVQNDTQVLYGIYLGQLGTREMITGRK